MPTQYGQIIPFLQREAGIFFFLCETFILFRIVINSNILWTQFRPPLCGPNQTHLWAVWPAGLRLRPLFKRNHCVLPWFTMFYFSFSTCSLSSMEIWKKIKQIMFLSSKTNLCWILEFPRKVTFGVCKMLSLLLILEESWFYSQRWL